MTSPVLGIDLGTTNTVVAVCGRKGVTVLEDADGETLTPSIVSFVPSGDILVGRAARERRLIDAKNTVFSTKRLIGRPFRTPEVRRAAERAPYGLAESDNGGIEVRVRSERYSLPEVSAFVLRRARAIAEDALGQICSHAVLTVPASFNELQRTATRDAGRIAGLHVLRILNEPTAAALAYGFGARNDRRIAVFDLGGGTFDLSILDLSGDVIEVIATAGDSYLGGDDIDTLIADRMAAAFLAQHRVDLSSDAQGYERLRVAAEWLKVQLSSTERAHVRVEQAAYGAFGKSIDLEHSLTRAEHDQLISPLVARTFDICDSAMRVAGLRPTQVDEVILVGGQTIAPRVREMVAEYFGRVPLTNVHPSHVVAEGASVLGYALTGGSAGASAPVRVRTGGRPDLTTLVPPAPSMPPPAPTPPPTPSMAPPVTVSAPPEASSPRPMAGAALRGILPSAAPATLPPTPAPVFPGFDDDDDEPTRVADLPSMQEPRRQQRGPSSDRPELFTASEDEPTEHMPPRPEPLAAARPAAAPIAPLREDLRAQPGEERKSSPPRAPAAGVPLAAVSLRRSSPPPPAPAIDIDPLPMAPLPRVGGFRSEQPAAPPAGSLSSTIPGISNKTPSVRPQTAPPISVVEAAAHVRAPGPLTSTKRHTAPPPADGDEVALRISSLPPPPPPLSTPPPPAHPTPLPARVLSPVPPPHSVSSGPPAASVVMPATMKLPPPPVHVAPPAPPGSAWMPATTKLPAQPAPPAAPVAPAPSVAPAAPRRSKPAPTKTAKLPAAPAQPPERKQPASVPPPAIDIEEPVSRAPLLIDVTPHTLAVETAGGFCEPIVERNAPIPTEQTRRFSTSQDFQSSVRMRICQGEGRRVEQNQLLGTIELTELRPAARGAVKIEVTFVIDADGTLSVRARDDATGKSQRVRIDLLGGLSEESVTRMYKRQKGLTVRG